MFSNLGSLTQFQIFILFITPLQNLIYLEILVFDI